MRVTAVRTLLATYQHALQWKSLQQNHMNVAVEQVKGLRLMVILKEVEHGCISLIKVAKVRLFVSQQLPFWTSTEAPPPVFKSRFKAEASCRKKLSTSQYPRSIISDDHLRTANESSLVPNSAPIIWRVPRPLPGKAERGSSVLSDIFCHMGRGLRCEDCHIYNLHPGLEFSVDLNCCTVRFSKAR